LLLKAVLKRVALILDQIGGGLRQQREIHIVDYGAGTGMAALELLRACQDYGYLDRCDRLGIRFRLLLLDIPSAWFDKAAELFADCPFVEFHAIRDSETGRFFPLDQVLSSGEIDIVMASMVFHLIRPESLCQVMQNISSILGPSGLLIWNSPDIGPASSTSVLFHEANRRLRGLFCEFLSDPDLLFTTRWARAAPNEVESVREYLQSVRRRLSPEELAKTAALANSQILPRPNELEDVLHAASSLFDLHRSHTASFEIRQDEVIDTLLVPSNQRYLGEIPDRQVREEIIRGLMTHDVIPALRLSEAATLLGYSVHWTYGELTKRG
jgi:SAM-dependent methyltransferase